MTLLPLSELARRTGRSADAWHSAIRRPARWRAERLDLLLIRVGSRWYTTETLYQRWLAAAQAASAERFAPRRYAALETLFDRHARNSGERRSRSGSGRSGHSTSSLSGSAAPERHGAAPDTKAARAATRA